MIASIDRRRIYIFVGISWGLSIVVGLVIFFTGGLYGQDVLRPRPQAAGLMRLLMFSPAIAHIASRLITREGWSNMLLWPRFRRGWPYYLAAWILLPLATIAGGAIYYLLFPDRFDPSRAYATETLRMGSAIDGPPATVVLDQTLLAMLMVWFYLHLMFGEEFGWRAYLLPKLMPLGGRKAVLLVGVIHGAWHWPFIFMGLEYGLHYWGAPVAGPLVWLLVTCLVSVMLAWVTLRSGSVWPAVLGHGMLNVGGGLMLYFIKGAPDTLLGPVPVGIVAALGYALLAVPIFLSARALAPMAAPPPAASKPVEAAARGAAG